jgi:hypothetical protein
MIVLKKMSKELLWDWNRVSGFSQSMVVAGWNERIINACKSTDWYESMLLTPKVVGLPQLPFILVESSCQHGQVFLLAIGPLALINCPLIH